MIKRKYIQPIAEMFLADDDCLLAGGSKTEETGETVKPTPDAGAKGSSFIWDDDEAGQMTSMAGGPF